MIWSLLLVLEKPLVEDLLQTLNLPWDCLDLLLCQIDCYHLYISIFCLYYVYSSFYIILYYIIIALLSGCNCNLTSLHCLVNCSIVAFQATF